MKLGLIAYADDTGLGSQTKAYFDHLKPFRTMLIDRTGSNTEHPFYPERYPEIDMIVRGVPDFDQVELFLTGLDVVLMAETSPSEHLMRVARARGVKTVIVPNYEYWHHQAKKNLLHPDLYMPGTLWHYEAYPDPKAYLPFPTDPQPREPLPDTATNFVHVAGNPIYPDRNGTEIVLRSLAHITANVKVTIFCQKPAFIDTFLQENDLKVPENVQLSLRTSVKSTDELYEDQHVLVMPRRFGGLCLPVNEALSFGLPVIMPDIEPNNLWLPKDWLIPAEVISQRKMSTMIDVYGPDPEALAVMINKLRNGRALYWRFKEQAAQLAEQYSWDRLVVKYIETLTTMV